MVWGILGALDEEVALIASQMHITRTTHMLGTTFHVGTVHGKHVVVACCGIGKVNAAVCATTLLQHFQTDCVINVGIAGAMAHGLRVLDVVVASEVCFHDQDAVMQQYYPKCTFFPADAALIALCQRACLTLSQPITLGRIASGDVFVSDSATKTRILTKYTPACVEMEGAAIGHVAFMHDKPYLVIRTMSDTADDAAQQTYDDFMHRAAEQSARIVLQMLALD